MGDSGRLIPVRPGEELDLEALGPFLNKVLDTQGGSWQVQQYSAGHSNLTYLLSSDHRQVVLRRPPQGPVALRAHDMVREARFLRALGPRYPWAPAIVAVCEDPDLLGVPFFLMEPRLGLAIDRAWAEYTPEMGKRVSELMIDRLVDLHALDWRSLDWGGLVKPQGFLPRQVSGWIERYQRARIDPIPEADALSRWLIDHVPDQTEATVIHYDYKLDNVLFHEDLGDVSAVFDWEMATVGDPLADLGVAMSYWWEPGDPPGLQTSIGEVPMTVEPGFYTRSEWVQAYARKSQRDIRHFGYYLKFAYFKLAVIIAQIYFRYVQGQTQDPRFHHFNRTVQALMHIAFTTPLAYWGD